MSRAGSRQLTFVFADSPSGSGDDRTADASEGRAYLLYQAGVKEASDPAARADRASFDGDSNLKSRMCGPQVRFCERPGGAIPRAYSTVPPTTPAAAAAAGAEPLASPGGEGVPDPAVSEKPVRRRFTAEYKIRMLREADRCTQPGQLGALLRREGLYSSHLNSWRHQRDAGALAGLAPKRRGRKPKADDPLLAENQRLRRENQRLAEKLRQAEAIIEVQKKLSELLGMPLTPPDNRENKS